MKLKELLESANVNDFNIGDKVRIKSKSKICNNKTGIIYYNYDGILKAIMDENKVFKNFQFEPEKGEELEKINEPNNEHVRIGDLISSVPRGQTGKVINVSGDVVTIKFDAKQIVLAKIKKVDLDNEKLSLKVIDTGSGIL